MESDRNREIAWKECVSCVNSSFNNNSTQLQQYGAAITERIITRIQQLGQKNCAYGSEESIRAIRFYREKNEKKKLNIYAAKNRMKRRNFYACISQKQQKKK